MEDNTPKRPDLFEFSDPMTRGERIAAWIYLPIHVVGVPLLLGLLAALWPDGGLTDTRINGIYYGLGALYMFAFLWRYLRGGYDVLMDNIRRCLVALLMGWVLNLLLSISLSLVLMALGSELAGSPNNDAVAGMAETNYTAIFALSVFLAPVVEEPLFRGAVFGGIRARSRVAAYAVSAILFAVYHVWQYAVLYADPAYLLYAVTYLPVSLALCYVYEKSGSIWAPILFHMLVNLLSMSVLVGM